MEEAVAAAEVDAHRHTKQLLFVLQNVLRVPGLWLLEFLCLASQDYLATMPTWSHFQSPVARASFLLVAFVLAMVTLSCDFQDLVALHVGVISVACYAAADWLVENASQENTEAGKHAWNTLSCWVIIFTLSVVSSICLRGSVKSWQTPMLYSLCLLPSVFPWIPSSDFVFFLHRCIRWTLLFSMIPIIGRVIASVIGYLIYVSIKFCMLLQAPGLFRALPTLFHHSCHPVALLIFGTYVVAECTWQEFLKGHLHGPTFHWLPWSLATLSSCIRSPVSFVSMSVAVGFVHLGSVAAVSTALAWSGAPAGHRADGEETGLESAGVFVGFVLLSGWLDKTDVEDRMADLLVVLYIVSCLILHSLLRLTYGVLRDLSAAAWLPSHRKKLAHATALIMHLGLLLASAVLSWGMINSWDNEPLQQQNIDGEDHSDAIWILLLASGHLLNSCKAISSIIIYLFNLRNVILESPHDYAEDVDFYSSVGILVSSLGIYLYILIQGGQAMWNGAFGPYETIGVVFGCLQFYGDVGKTVRTLAIRKQASKTISSFPAASPSKLRAHDDVCPICLSPMIPANIGESGGDCCRITPCGHFFHERCLLRWLYRRPGCPYCDQKLSPSNFGN